MNACKSNPCKHGGKCLRNGTDYTCMCMIGYEGDDCKGGLYCFRYNRLIVCFIPCSDTMKVGFFFCGIKCSSEKEKEAFCTLQIDGERFKANQKATTIHIFP